jgi:hypothetical protein
MPPVWTLVTPPAGAIVTLAQAKTQTNTADFADDDALLTELCQVVTDWLELSGGGTIGRPLQAQSWAASFPGLALPPDFLLPRRVYAPQQGLLIDRSPVTTISKVEYLSAGTYQTLDPSLWVQRQLASEYIFIRPPIGAQWPATDRDEAAWRVTAAMGFASVPTPIQRAALMLLGHLYQNREAVTGFGAALQETPLGMAALLVPYRAPGV